MKTYIEKRQLVVDKARELVKSVYPKDTEMERLIEGQIQTFENTRTINSKVADAFVEGLLGFVQWCKTQSTRKVEDSEILTTFIHDLREYNCNRREAWFSPRSAGYRKFYTEEPEGEVDTVIETKKIRDFAISKMEEANDVFTKEQGYDLRKTNNGDHLRFSNFEIRKNTLILRYKEVTPHDCPASVGLEYPLSDLPFLISQPSLTEKEKEVIDEWIRRVEYGIDELGNGYSDLTVFAEDKDLFIRIMEEYVERRKSKK